MADVTLPITPADVSALEQLRDEIFPGYSLEAVALKCMRDELVRCGILEPGGRHRSRGAKAAGRR